MPKEDMILRSPTLERNLLTYILQATDSSNVWWRERVMGSNLSRLDMFTEFRLRYQSRRSVAQLWRDIKDEPFPRSSNIGIGLEQIFGEFLIPTFLSNTHDLDPCLQAVDEGTGKEDDALTAFHDKYQRDWHLNKRSLLEESNREILTVGGVFHKWYWSSIWKQTERVIYVFSHPETGPVMLPNPQTGQMDYLYADPSMPEENWPTAPDGAKLKMEKLPSYKMSQVKEGPRLTLRPYENMEFPPGETRLDPNEWDWLADNYQVSPFWFLGREGDPFEGKMQNLDKLFRHYRIDPNKVAEAPDKRLCDPIPLKEWHGKFPVTASGRPVEIIATVAPEANLLLGWRLSPFVRRPYFNRQVRTRKDFPLGVGICETLWGFRNALDALLNQDVDAGNLYNHPPMLLSSLAMLEDEEYEMVGAGTQWIMTDINGAKFLPPPTSQRNPMEMLSWLIGQAQRIWGVTDLNLNAPSQSMSPNVHTATGVISVMNQGNVKFGHFVKRLTETDTKEYDFQHEMWRSMMANPRTISVNGQPQVIESKDRDQFFREGVSIKAVGNGISTNPSVRQQVLSQARVLFINDPFVMGDMSNLKDLDEQTLAAFGVKLQLKDPQTLQDTQVLQAMMKTPQGEALIKQAVAQFGRILQATQAVNPKGKGMVNQAQGTTNGAL